MCLKKSKGAKETPSTCLEGGVVNLETSATVSEVGTGTISQGQGQGRGGQLPTMFWGKEVRVMSDAQLRRLKEHKYSAASSSMMDPALQKWWNWLVIQVPFWLAPNLITTLGLIVNIISSLILVYFSPDCRTSAPGWACFLCAFGLFVYQSLDAIDGKQARRTNTSSPLGELFDHGCDSISTVFVSLALCVSCQLGTTPKMMFLQSFGAITLFYCAHWQTYVSGTLRFGYIDVTEAQLGIIAVHILSGIFGCEIWTYPLLFGMQWGAIPVLIALGCGVWSLVHTVEIIFTGGVGKNGSTVAGTSVLSPVIPYSLVLVPAIMIAGNSRDDLYGRFPALYILTFGLIAAKVTNRLVVAHMTKSEMDYLDSALLGPFLLFMNQYFSYLVAEEYLLLFGLAWASFDLWNYCSKVCHEICDSLNIYLFKIPHATTNANSKSQVRNQTIPISNTSKRNTRMSSLHSTTN